MRGRKRKNDIPSREFENVVSLYKNKISLKQIAFDYDVTAYVVRGLLVDMGVKIARRGRRKVKPRIGEIRATYTGTTRAVETGQREADNQVGQTGYNLDLFRKPLGEDNAER